MPRYLTKNTLACLTRQDAEALALRMQAGVDGYRALKYV